jgi:putative transposase
VAQVIFGTVRRYHDEQRFYLKLILLMPDHLHMLIGVPGDTQLTSLIRDLKRITARLGKIEWQRNFFDHRVRRDESEDDKTKYIRANPVRAGLIGLNDVWPFAIGSSDLDVKPKC